jgi:uncharacterized protein (TIGR02001 family)
MRKISMLLGAVLMTSTGAAVAKVNEQNRTEHLAAEALHKEIKEHGMHKDGAAEQESLIAGSLSLVSDYVSRGQTQTFGGPAVQGELIVNPEPKKGFYLGLWASNISHDTVPNGAGVELNPYVGCRYEFVDDGAVKLELRGTLYPKGYTVLPPKERYDMYELIPGISYKWLTVNFAYSLTSVSAFNANFAPTIHSDIVPNGTSAGSWYWENIINLPIQGEDLSLDLGWAYQHMRHYSKLSYGITSVALNYKLPKTFGDMKFVTAFSSSDAKREYYFNTNADGLVKRSMRKRVWFGLIKEF